MIRRPPRSTRVRSSAASDVYKRQRPHSSNGSSLDNFEPVKGIPQTALTRFPPAHRHLRSRSASASFLPFLFLARRSALSPPHIVRGVCAPCRISYQKAHRDAKDDEHMADDELCREKTAEAEVPSLHWTRLSHPRPLPSLKQLCTNCG